MFSARVQASARGQPQPAAKPKEPHVDRLSGSDNYQGLTNKADFAQVHRAQKVHIISTPWITNKPAAEKARATKNFLDNSAAGVYTFNPNSGLTAAAAAHNMDAEQQGQMWLKLWTDVCKKTQQTGGTCYVMAKGTGQHDRVIEGKAQYGEINIAEMAKVPSEYVYY